MLTHWVVFIHPDALRQLYAIPRGKVVPISDVINALKTDPFGLGQTDVEGRRNTYRIQRSEYNIVYAVMSEQRTIKVLWIESTDEPR